MSFVFLFYELQKIFFVPLIWSQFHPLRLKKPVKYLGSNLIFCWYGLTSGFCSHISSATILAVSELTFFEKILPQLGIEQFFKFQMIRESRIETTKRLDTTITMVQIGVFGRLI